MKKLFQYLKTYIAESIAGPLFKMTEALLELFVPLVMADIIDTGIGSNDVPYIIRKSLLLGLLSLVGFGFSVTAQYFAAKAAVGCTGKLRHALFEKIGTFSHSQLESTGTSTLITRMTSDANQVQNGLNLTLRLLLRSPFVVFGAMIMAFRIDAHLAMIFVWTTIALFVVVFAVMLVCISLYKRVQSGLDRVMRLTRENLTGARVIRAFCKESDEIKGFDEANSALTAMQLFTGRISALMNPVTFLIINISIMILIYKGDIAVSAGVLTTGAVVALYNYMSQILVELIKLANLSINIAKSIACANRIEKILDTDGALSEGTVKFDDDTDSTVSFDDVSFTYTDASDSSVENITFTAAPGETVGIIGATGSGKSTIISLIPRFYDCTRGTVSIGGRSVSEYDTASLRSVIGVVPQKAVLFKGTIRENLLWGNENASDEELTAAAEAAQALDVIEYKGGLDAQIQAGGSDLSGGQRQRLTIARALVRRPRILILDDSASALDMATDGRLRRAIAALDYSPTVFIVSQRTASVMNADKIIVLDDGVIADIGTHDELVRRCAIYREIHELQTGGVRA